MDDTGKAVVAKRDLIKLLEDYQFTKSTVEAFVPAAKGLLDDFDCKLSQFVRAACRNVNPSYWDAVQAAFRAVDNQPQSIAEIQRRLRTLKFKEGVNQNAIRGGLHKFFKSWLASGRITLEEAGPPRRYALCRNYVRGSKRLGPSDTAAD